MVELLTSWLSLKRDRRAVTALEYALIAGLVAVVISAALLRMGNNMKTILITLGTTLSGV